jgi:hypothetical protein
MNANKESDGFKFATMLLATLGTIVYASYTYFQSRAIDPNIYAFFVGLITALLTCSILLIIFVFLKGYSMEVENPKKLKPYALYIYSITFEVGLMVFLAIMGAYWFIFYGYYYPYYLLYILLIFIVYYLLKIRASLREKGLILVIVGGYWFFYPYYLYISVIILIIGIIDHFACSRKSAQDLKCIIVDSFKRVFPLFIVFGIVILWTFLYAPMLDLLQGDAKIDMNSVYYKNGEPIPVTIEITGRDPGLSIYLYNATSTSDIYNITLKTEHQLNETNVSKYLIGDAFASGKYYIFINTTNMSEGYYRLAYSHSMNGRSIDEYKYGKSFYLLSNLSNRS